MHPANLQNLCRCSDQRDRESPVRVGKYLLPVFSLRSSQPHRSKTIQSWCHHTESTLPQHPVKVNSVTLWSVLDGLAARGAYRGWYKGCIQTIQAVCIWRPLYSPDIYPGSPYCSRAGGCKDVVAGFLVDRSPILMVWLSSVYLATTLPRSSCLRVGTRRQHNTPKLCRRTHNLIHDAKSEAAFDVKSESNCAQFVHICTTCVHNFWQNSHCWQKLQIKVQNKSNTTL